MMNLFFFDSKRGTLKTYDNLIQDINNLNYIGKYIHEKDPYSIILKIIQSLLHGAQFEIIDSDFSQTELNNIGVSYEEINKKEECNTHITDLNHLYQLIEINKNNWKLSIYTSGTTGRPKKVTHTYETMTRNTKIGDRWRDNVWAYAYNPTHFAGLQVLFQAFLNRNPIIYVFDINSNEVSSLLNKYNVTNISATPTYYRNIMHFFQEPVETVNRVTSGGEKFDSDLKKSILKVFPNAKITNIYASTEAGSLFAANGDRFIINERIKKYIKITDDGELCIHKSLLGISEFFSETEWYHTGDIVELINENEFIFISRKTELINVGGYKVNPHEVEEEIKKFDWVIDVLVKQRENSVTGNILIAEVILLDGIDKSDAEIKLMTNLKNNLQPWKVPRIFKFVDKIEKTRSGKKVRK